MVLVFFWRIKKEIRVILAVLVWGEVSKSSRGQGIGEAPQVGPFLGQVGSEWPGWNPKVPKVPPWGQQGHFPLGTSLWGAPLSQHPSSEGSRTIPGSGILPDSHPAGFWEVLDVPASNSGRAGGSARPRSEPQELREAGICSSS